MVTGFVMLMVLMVMIIILVVLFEVTIIPEFLLVSVFFFVVHMFETLGEQEYEQPFTMSIIIKIVMLINTKFLN